MHHESQEKFSILGYVIINGVVILLTAVAWFAAKTGLFLFPPVEAAGRPGVGALLVFVPICFLLATGFDIVWQIARRRRDAHREAIKAAPKKEAPARELASKEVEKT